MKNRLTAFVLAGAMGAALLLAGGCCHMHHRHGDRQCCCDKPCCCEKACDKTGVECPKAAKPEEKK
ncbi:MAG TPA: hypothetical protein VIU40_12420 [Geobacteraceae bacterium]